MKSSMKLEDRDDGVWITNIPECGDIGPHTRAEATEIRAGLKRTFDNWDDPSFFTCDPPRK